MSALLEYFVRHMAIWHDRIMRFNDSYEMFLSDKQLHFVIMGLVGIGILLVIYPLFKLLSKNHVVVIAFIYVFTVMTVLTFAVEIGQGFTGSGTMDMDDAVAGMSGFIALFILFIIVRAIILGVFSLIKDITDKD